jgi:hypothetical protein
MINDHVGRGFLAGRHVCNRSSLVELHARLKAVTSKRNCEVILQATQVCRQLLIVNSASQNIYITRSEFVKLSAAISRVSSE